MTSDTDFRRFLVIAKGSAQEAIVWTDYCKDLEFIDHETWEKWKNEYDEISRMLFASSGNSKISLLVTRFSLLK